MTAVRKVTRRAAPAAAKSAPRQNVLSFVNPDAWKATRNHDELIRHLTVGGPAEAQVASMLEKIVDEVEQAAFEQHEEELEKVAEDKKSALYSINEAMETIMRAWENEEIDGAALYDMLMNIKNVVETMHDHEQTFHEAAADCKVDTRTLKDMPKEAVKATRRGPVQA